MRGFRSILIVAFAGMLLIFGGASVEAVRLLRTMRTENQVLRAQARESAGKLATVRYCLLLSQNYPAASESDVRERWTKMLADLGGDSEQLAQLRAMLRQHWVMMNRAMDNGDVEASPLQVSAIEITQRVEDIDARQTAATQLEVQDQFERLGQGLGLALNLSLASALLLAIGCGVYILRIERQNHGRYQEIVQLSARLVDAQETERRTISRELHDQVGQTLNAVLVDAANLAKRIPPDDEVGQRYLNNIRSYADSSVNSIRDISLFCGLPCSTISA